MNDDFPKWHYNEDTELGEIQYEDRKGYVMAGKTAIDFNLIMTNLTELYMRKNKMWDVIRSVVPQYQNQGSQSYQEPPE